jgi:hypothetical protein
MIKAAHYLAALTVTVAIMSGATQHSAQPAPLPMEGLPPSTRIIHAGYWPAACPFGTHYVCWHGSYGGRYCGCWHGGDAPACPAGYHFSCRPDAFGGLYCACY